MTTNFREEQYLAKAGTGTAFYYRWEEDALVRIYTENYAIDSVVEETNTLRGLERSERRPGKLRPIIKQFFDALNDRIQLLLVLHANGVADATTRGKIETNPPDFSGNLKKFIKLLCEDAFPDHRSLLKAHFARYANLVDELMWIRNKGEHAAPTLWSLPSYVHTGRDKQPNMASEKILDWNYAAAVNRFVVDTLLLLIEVAVPKPNPSQFARLKSARIPED